MEAWNPNHWTVREVPPLSCLVPQLTDLDESFEDTAAFRWLCENAHKYGFILRAKGIVEGADGEWIHFDYVPGEADVRTGSAGIIGRACVIGSKLDTEKIKEMLS